MLFLPGGGGVYVSTTSAQHPSDPSAARTGYSGRVVHLYGYIALKSHGSGRKEYMEIIHKALLLIIETLYESAGFDHVPRIWTFGIAFWLLLLTVLTFWKGKMYLQYNTARRWSARVFDGIRCMVTSEDLETLGQGPERTIIQATWARTRVEVILDDLRNTYTTNSPAYFATRQVSEMWKRFSLSLFPSKFEDIYVPRCMLLRNVYYMLSYESPHTFHPGISQLL